MNLAYLIGMAAKHAANEQGLSLKSLSQITTISPHRLSRMFAGKTDIFVSEFIALGEALGCLDEFFRVCDYLCVPRCQDDPAEPDVTFNEHVLNNIQHNNTQQSRSTATERK